MCLGLAQFLYGQHKLGTAGLPLGQTKLNRLDWQQIIVISLGMILLVYVLLESQRVLAPLWQRLSFMYRFMIGFPALLILWKIGASSAANSRHKQLTAHDCRRVLYICILGLFVVFFWMGFEQAGGTMNLFADQRTDRMLLGWQIPASYFQSINPLTIILLGPFMASLWIRLDQSRFACSTPVKMALGMILLGSGFMLLAFADMQSPSGKVGPQWLLMVYLLHTMGELCLSPVGLAMVTNIAPARLVSMMLGIWYISNAFANYLAGILESLLLQTGWSTYGFLVVSSLGAGILLFLISPWLNRLLVHTTTS